MILVDTNIWVDHLRIGDDEMSKLLNDQRVLTHPFIIGELACGKLQNRASILSWLEVLPKVQAAQDDEVLYFIDRHNLAGQGIGYIDAHLLAAVSLNVPAQLWTRDRRLKEVAQAMMLAYDEN